MGPAQGVGVDFGQPPMKDFPLPDEVCHDGGYVFDGDLRVLAMLVVDVDMVGLKALE